MHKKGASRDAPFLLLDFLYYFVKFLEMTSF